MARPRKKPRTEVPTTPPPAAPSTPPPASPSDETPLPKEDESDQYVSIAAELSFIGRAVDGAVLLTDALVEDAVFTSDAAKRIPQAVVAVLGLVHGRLAQVQRVLRGSADPLRVLMPHNASGPLSREEDPDIRLGIWTHDQRIEYHSRELHMAETEKEIAARREG